jgi:hypothetical protein
MKYNEGYHGTDEPTARKIFEEGFQKESSDGLPMDVYLAAPFQTYLAHSHGEKNARRSNSENYAILRASIPESKIKINDLGPESLRLFGDEIDRIAIIGLSVYTRSGELIEGEPVIETNEW